MTFTSIDFETATKHHICAVGIVSVENGVIVDEYYTLIQPQSGNPKRESAHRPEYHATAKEFQHPFIAPTSNHKTRPNANKLNSKPRTDAYNDGNEKWTEAKSPLDFE